MSATLNEQDQWVDEATGELVVNGFVYYGDQNLDPVLNPLTGGIFSDRGLTIALSNPQRTGADGRTVNKVWLSGRYSLKLEDSNNVQLYQELDVGENEVIGNTSLTNVQGTNTITADGVPTVDELIDGQFYVFKPVITNTGAVTLQIDSTTAKAIEVNGGALTGSELVANITVAVAFNLAADVFDMVGQINRDALGLGTGDTVQFSKLGVGGALTDGTLHVVTAGAGSVAASVNADDLVVENSASGGISILVPDANNCNLYFGSPTDNIGAIITYQQSIALLSIGTHITGGQVRFDSAIGVEAMRIDASQRITMPSQPAFLVTADAQANVTGNGTNYVMLWANEIADRGGNFASNTFTAPVTGLYLLTVTVNVSGITTAADSGTVIISTSNRDYTEKYNDTDMEITGRAFKYTVLADMDAADIASIVLRGNGESGDVWDVDATSSTFSGMLLA